MYKFRKGIGLALIGGALLVGAVVSPASPASAAGCSINSYLSEGERGSSEVRCVQTALNAAGFKAGPVDGWFGPVTEAATLRYQAAKNLIEDGIVGPQTGGSLGIWQGRVVNAAPAVSTAKPAATQSQGSAWNGSTGGVFLTSGARQVLASGRCNWLAPYLSAAGLPVGTFMAISARESGCAPGGVHVVRASDLSTSRFGLNFRGSMPSFWASICGVSDWTAPGRSVSVDVACAAAAYHRSGLSPWAVG